MPYLERYPSKTSLKKMSKRLRKKYHVGEFRTYIAHFVFECSQNIEDWFTDTDLGNQFFDNYCNIADSCDVAGTYGNYDDDIKGFSSNKFNILLELNDTNNCNKDDLLKAAKKFYKQYCGYVSAKKMPQFERCKLYCYDGNYEVDDNLYHKAYFNMYKV